MTQTPSAPLSGFDIYITKGTSSITSFVPDPITGEFPVTPPATWSSVQLDITEIEPEMNGYRYAMVYYEVQVTVTPTPPTPENPEGGTSTTYTKIYPNWTLVSQTIEKSSPSRDVFYKNDGTELFPSLPQPQFVGGGQTTQGGITDGTRYSYLRVFDQAELSWLPRCSTIQQKPIEKGLMPDGMIQPDLPYPWYPMDTVNSVVPDEREEIPITYTVTTQYQLGTGGAILSHSFTITHVCTQNPELTGEKLENIMNKCYYTHGFYHIQLYDIDAPPNYDEYGNPIGEVREPIYLKNETESELVGFDVYELQNSVWNYNGLEHLDEDTTASELELERVVDDGLSQIEGLEDVMASEKEQYETEMAAIEASQAEYAELIEENKKRQEQLLSNLNKMITSPETFFDEDN
jgi:hypothetical protein